MFSKPLYIAYIILLIAIGSATYPFIQVDDQDRQLYHSLMNTTEVGNSDDKSHQRTEQHRYIVHKQILSTNEKNRLESHLKSEYSEVAFDHISDNAEIIERFTNTLFSSQEELYSNPNQQLLRIIKADKATYHYRSGMLVADRVHFARYKIPGHRYSDPDLKSPPLMSGEALQFELSLNQKASFKAEKIKMQGDFL